MSGVVVDTHAALWYLADDSRLSAQAGGILDATAAAGEPIIVPSMCVAEAIYLAEKGRIPPGRLADVDLRGQRAIGEFSGCSVRSSGCHAMDRIPRELVPDLPDRVITATALRLNLPLVTPDSRIQAVGIATVW